MFLYRVLVRLKSGVLHTVQVTFRMMDFSPKFKKDYMKDKENGELVHDKSLACIVL